MRTKAEDKIKLVLIRHGETISNKEHRYLGRTDEALSSCGITKLKMAAGEELYPAADYLFTSPMRRCIQTAQLIYHDMIPNIIPDFAEMDFGEFEGKNYQDLKDDGRYQAWIDSNGTIAFPGGESRDEYIDRCRRGFEKMLTEFDHLREPYSQKETGEWQTIGLVVHGGTIMSLMHSFAGGEYFDYQVQNGRGYVCTFDGTRFSNIIKL